jgi:RNA polymerase sigma-70 factor (ECF subfamily)
VEFEELHQEMRLRLWHALGDSDRIHALAATYLYRTASSSAMELIRRRRSAGKVPLDALESLGLLQGGPSAHDELEQAELTAHVDVVIGTIPASRREVVRLYFAGYRVGEIAVRFGWTETRVRNLVSRGVAEVRVRLRDAGVHGG